MYTGVDIEATMNSFMEFTEEQGIEDVKRNYGAVCIAQAILHLSDSIRYMTYRLGTADAASPMGAIEMVGSELHNIADALTGLQK